MGIRIFALLFSSIFAISSGIIGNELATRYLGLNLFLNASDPGRAPTWEYPFSNYWFPLASRVLFILLGALLGFLAGSSLFHRSVSIARNMKRIPIEDKIASTLGTLIALVPAIIFGSIITKLGIQEIVVVVAIILLQGVVWIWLGNIIALSMKEEIKFLIPGLSRNMGIATSNAGPTTKLLDTNIIIDGRIYDICRSGFLEGTLVLPGFVLEELHHIADSADALRRNRGRRGLDILHQMQTEISPGLQMLDRYKVSFAPGDGVDIKLVKLAKAMEVDIITNDFNLNKVAKLHGVRVLNINELANAVKPVVLPGEELVITIIKEGKEYNQGVGYLDDGTMVVVENGKRMIGDNVTVVVTSVLQTVAGKMIFAELKYDGEGSDEHNHYSSGRGGRRKTY